jgi:hypothetical protein
MLPPRAAEPARSFFRAPGTLNANHLRALALLFDTPSGMTEHAFLPHGITAARSPRWCASATAKTEHVVAGKKEIELMWLWITEAGRAVLGAS